MRANAQQRAHTPLSRQKQPHTSNIKTNIISLLQLDICNYSTDCKSTYLHFQRWTPLFTWIFLMTQQALQRTTWLSPFFVVIEIFKPCDNKITRFRVLTLKVQHFLSAEWLLPYTLEGLKSRLILTLHARSDLRLISLMFWRHRKVSRK